jgi:hypothetical protein
LPGSAFPGAAGKNPKLAVGATLRISAVPRGAAAPAFDPDGSPTLGSDFDAPRAFEVLSDPVVVCAGPALNPAATGTGGDPPLWLVWAMGTTGRGFVPTGGAAFAGAAFDGFSPVS